MKKNKKKSLFIKCASCGTNMEYSNAKGGLVCLSCGNVKPIQDENNKGKKPLDDEALELGKIVKNANEKDEEQAVFKCYNCGADIELNAFEISKVCPYCLSANVSDLDLEDGLKPDKIIKFAIEKDQVFETAKKNLKRAWFLPNKFKAHPKPTSVHALYFPSFTFDANSFTKYAGELYCYENDSDGGSKKRYFRVSGEITMQHRNTIIECCSALSQSKLNYVLPYNYNSKIDFKKEYLLGYEVERYDNSLETGFNNAKSIYARDIKRAIIKKHNADGEKSLDLDTNYKDKMFDYTILPIYLLMFDYRGKKYTGYMNGQTGKVGGRFPLSPWKIGFFSFGVVAIILLIIILASLAS